MGKQHLNEAIRFSLRIETITIEFLKKKVVIENKTSISGLLLSITI